MAVWTSPPSFSFSQFLRGAVVLTAVLAACSVQGRSLRVAGNTATDDFDPVSGYIYLGLRTRLQTDFPGTTFTSLPALTGELSRYDLVILNRFSSRDLMATEQAAIRDYVLHGGNLLYVGEAIGSSNDTFTGPFGISMMAEPATNASIAYGTYTNPGHSYLLGPFGAPSKRPSGSFAAQVSMLGPSVELARWNGGGVAISAFERGALGPGAGFGLFLSDVNMVTPARYSGEVGPVISNALSTLPEIQPNLSISVGSGEVTVTWDSQAVGWTLQSSEDLTSWGDIGTGMACSGSFTETSGNSKRFFRLRK